MCLHTQGIFFGVEIITMHTSLCDVLLWLWCISVISIKLIFCSKYYFNLHRCHILYVRWAVHHSITPLLQTAWIHQFPYHMPSSVLYLKSDITVCVVGSIIERMMDGFRGVMYRFSTCHKLLLKVDIKVNFGLVWGLLTLQLYCS